MPHLLDIRHEGLDVPEEGPELRAPAEPLQMPFGRIPLDPQHIAGRVFRAACQFIGQAVGRGEERLAGQAVRPFKLDAPLTRESVTDVLNDHRKLLDMNRALQRVGSMPCSDRRFDLIDQGASQLNGIRTLLKAHDQRVLQCPHVSETSGEPLAAPSGAPRIVAESYDAFARLEKLGAVCDEFVKVCEEAAKKITEHTVKAHVDPTVRKAVN